MPCESLKTRRWWAKHLLAGYKRDNLPSTQIERLEAAVRTYASPQWPTLDPDERECVYITLSTEGERTPEQVRAIQKGRAKERCGPEYDGTDMSFQTMEDYQDIVDRMSDLNEEDLLYADDDGYVPDDEDAEDEEDDNG